MSNYHSLKIEEVFKGLKTSAAGLTSKEAERRLKKYGLNELPKEKVRSKTNIFLGQFKDPLVYILSIAALISLFLMDWIDMGVIIGVVILNTIIGYINESKADNILNKLKQFIIYKAIVLRDGHEIEVESGFLAVGDIIILKSGSRVQVDGRIIEANNLLINEATLTGESIPVEKTEIIQKTGVSLADRKNMVYAGTIVVKGTSMVVITAIGKNTELGKIAKLVSETKEEKTPLQKRLIKFSKILGIFLGVISAVVFLIGIIQGRPFAEMFITAVALIVSSLPEGLIVAVTVILVLGMQKILNKKALIRKLVAVETLGSTTVICSDKTGTLTEGKMSVAHIVIGEDEYEFIALNSKRDLEKAGGVILALQIALMCNEAAVENPQDELAVWKFIGAPTETALMSAAIQTGLDQKKLLDLEPKAGGLPFDNENKFMISIHKKKDGAFVLYEKGAPEKLLDKSREFYKNGKQHILTSNDKKKLNNIYEELTSRGLRVIGVATRGINSSEIAEWKNGYDWQKIDNNLIFVGFIALKDPLRPEVKETIKVCRQAGIRPIIITGDHPLTARAIAEEAGFKIKEKNIVIGEVLDQISDKDLEDRVNDIDIYARVNPHHKLRIVRALKARGEVVAMTGDGINDSPALKAADIGISLGDAADIAKEASDIILLDNNFKTIVEAIKQGRIIFSNIRKVITYLISDSFSEIILIVGSILAGMPLAVLPIQILWINIINDGFPNFSLAFERNDKDAMNKKPISKNEPIMNGQMKAIVFGASIIRDFLFLALFIYLFRQGLEINYLRTLFFAILGFKSLAAIFSLRNLDYPIWRINHLSNLYLTGAAFLSFILLILAIHWPPLQAILSTTALDIKSWILVFLAGAGGLVIFEATKYFFILRGQRRI